MKSKKGLIGLVVIVAVLVLGIGYAVVSAVSLSVTGTAAAATSDLDVTITAATPTAAPTIGAVSSPADKNATFTVTGMTGLSDTRTITYTVSNNESDVSAKVYVATPATDITVTNSEYFDVATSIDGVANAITIPHGQTATFTVTVSLKKIPLTNETNSSGNCTITITADPVNPTS